MYEVIYFSRGGSTQNLAAAMADELDTQARHVRRVKSLPETADIFLGTGLYFMRPAKMVRTFIRENDFRGKRVALFGTSTSGLAVETLWMEWLHKRKGAIIAGKYHCAGKFDLRFGKRRFCLRAERPSDRDIEKARLFARSVRDSLQVAAFASDTREVSPVVPESAN